MVSEKKRKQQLKAPDEFQKSGLKLVDWCAENQVIIVAAVVALFLLAGASVGYNFWQKSLGEKRREALLVIDDTYKKELQAAAKKAEPLQTEVDQISKQLRDLGIEGLTGSNAAELLDKKSKLEEKIGDFQADHSESLLSYKDFFKKNRSHSEGWRAGLQAVQILIHDSDYKGASEQAQSLLEAADTDKYFYAIQGRLLYASLLEELEDYPKALESIEMALNKAEEEIKPQILLAKARVQLLAKSSDEAAKSIKTLLDGYPDSSEAQKAKTLKALSL